MSLQVAKLVKSKISAYMFYRAEEHRRLTRKFSFTEIAERVGRQWRKMDDACRAKYLAKAADDSTRWEKEMRRARLLLGLTEADMNGDGYNTRSAKSRAKSTMPTERLPSPLGSVHTGTSLQNSIAAVGDLPNKVAVDDADKDEKKTTSVTTKGKARIGSGRSIRTGGERWSKKEICAFIAGLKRHGKNFRRVQKTVGKSKTLKQVLSFWHNWRYTKHRLEQYVSPEHPDASEARPDVPREPEASSEPLEDAISNTNVSKNSFYPGTSELQEL
eukprot:m.13426 g.13426  ORF g.13426 m.13426 type:complete len:273 (+) comp10111_c0_seq1:214-1032(+)